MTDPNSAMTAALHGAALTDATLRRAYGMFPSGITAICALLDHRPVGLVASSFTSATSYGTAHAGPPALGSLDRKGVEDTLDRKSVV